MKFSVRFFVIMLSAGFMLTSPLQLSNAWAKLPTLELKKEDIRVIPGGQTIGVKLNTLGVMVVGHHSIQWNGNHQVSPAVKARIHAGDMIIKVNDQRIQGTKHFTELIQKESKMHKKLRLQLKRNDRSMETNISPILDAKSGKYRLGIYVRDHAAGIGTLTFYSDSYRLYGALGHMITDIDTHAPLLVKDGEILPSEVTSIRKGEKGQPGEKRAQILVNQDQLGTIERNTDFGIFGDLLSNPQNNHSAQSLPIGTRDEVEEGPAQILTVVKGQTVEKFDIEILHLNKQDQPETRSMVLKITDRRLLNRTGGIIQGMSGSPIIQKGKIVGAVTHVFVNDPQSGYGCYIEWMLKDAGIKVKPD